MADNRPLHERLLCLTKYGFGTGYTMSDGESACTACPVSAQCWQGMTHEAGAEDPAGVERYQKTTHEVAQARGWSLDRAGKWVSSELLKFNIPDPYQRRMLKNMDNGMAKRQVDDPGVVARPFGQRRPTTVLGRGVRPS